MRCATRISHDPSHCQQAAPQHRRNTHDIHPQPQPRAPHTAHTHRPPATHPPERAVPACLQASPRLAAARRHKPARRATPRRATPCFAGSTPRLLACARRHPRGDRRRARAHVSLALCVRTSARIRCSWLRPRESCAGTCIAGPGRARPQLRGCGCGAR
jgi:hypothetical protein